MSVKIRLARGGTKKRPYYRIVIAQSESPRDGKFLEKVGTYNPMLPKDHLDRVRLVDERVKYWLSVGAQPTERVERFLSDKGFIKTRAIPNQTIKNKQHKKTIERLDAKEQKIRERAEALAAAAAAPAEEATTVEAEAPAAE